VEVHTSAIPAAIAETYYRDPPTTVRHVGEPRTVSIP